MNLSGLIKAVSPVLAGTEQGRGLSGRPGAETVPGLAYDSRKIGPGEVFFALPGTNTDGGLYIGQALAAGAGIIVGRDERPLSMAGSGALYLRVTDPRAALALASHEFHGRPTEKLALAGVTGTSGKTTTTYALEAVFQAAGSRAGVVGTNNYRFPGESRPAPVTTPESLELAEIFSAMVRAGVDRAVMEVSSHSLAQGRVRGCRFQAACFTNLSRDHLDYHLDMEDYFQAKRKLFLEFELPKGAALNLDDPYGRRLAKELGPSCLTFGLSAEARVRAEKVELSARGIKARVTTPAGDFTLDSPLLGGFNLQNFLGAAALALLLEVEPDHIAAGLNGLPVVPGRMEEVGRPYGRRVIVDYSHKVEALARALEVVRELTPGRVIALFGCGGDRDRGKRPLMGRVAAESSDLVILTSDNPRSENPYEILKQIAEGVEEAGARFFEPGTASRLNGRAEYTVVEDRREAIGLAVRTMGPEDTVLIAGKGHENYQLVGDKRLHLDDREEAVRALREVGA